MRANYGGSLVWRPRLKFLEMLLSNQLSFGVYSESVPKRWDLYFALYKFNPYNNFYYWRQWKCWVLSSFPSLFLYIPVCNTPREHICQSLRHLAVVHGLDWIFRGLCTSSCWMEKKVRCFCKSTLLSLIFRYSKPYLRNHLAVLFGKTVVMSASHVFTSPVTVLTYGSTDIRPCASAFSRRIALI